MSAASQFREQFTRPGDVMSVLLLLGGDVIHRALAQLSGTPFTPVAFSFGWTTYAITALLSSIGENQLLPPPDCPCLLLNPASGYARLNTSWILGRIVRDYTFWRSPAIPAAEAEFLDRHGRIGLTVAVYRAAATGQAVPVNDWLWYSGVVCAVLQLGVAAIPWALYGDWSIFLTSAVGVVLAAAAGALPQWAAEKWACRRNSAKTFVLTKGNGSSYAIVVRGDGVGLDLEDLAGGRGAEVGYTRPATAVLSVCWVGLLVAVSGLKENPWFLLVVGVMGMVQNLLVCGMPRRPEAFGVQLEFEEVVLDRKVMGTLKALETKYPGVGRCLVPTFFPGSLREDEVQWWKEAEAVEMQLKMKPAPNANLTVVKRPEQV